jgi:hypothetical protein
MEADLFGNKILNEESFEIIYKGSSFGNGKILVRDLYLELQGLESVLKESVNLLIKNNKITSEFKDFSIYVEIEKGSICEKVRVVFKNKTTIAIVGTFIIPFLNTTYDHFLNGKKTPENNQFYHEMKVVEQDSNFKNNLKNLLSPLSNNDDNMVINNGTIDINITYPQKEEIVKNLNEEAPEDDLKKNGEFIETLTGTIRKLDLDASGNNYFGFNIDNGQSKVPTAIKGEFNLNDYKEVLNEPIRIKGKVKYVDDQIKHIEIESYETINKQEKLAF